MFFFVFAKMSTSYVRRFFFSIFVRIFISRAYIPSGVLVHVAIVFHSVLHPFANIADLQRFKSSVRLRISCMHGMQCRIWMYRVHARTLSFIRHDYILLQRRLYVACLLYRSHSLLIFYHLCICAAAAVFVAIADDDVGFHFGLESSLERKKSPRVSRVLFILFFPLIISKINYKLEAFKGTPKKNPNKYISTPPPSFQ